LLTSPKKICVVFGTRPEAIKLLPLVTAARSDPRFDCRVCVTAQHRELLDQVLSAFRIPVDKDLDLMKPAQSLSDLTSRAITAIGEYLETAQPDLVLVQGDTTTSFCAALAAFYRKIPVGHVEAGLRTRNVESPWPEEANRVLISRLAELHFAPTESSRDNLVAEGISPERVLVTGNTVIDALFLALEHVESTPPDIDGVPTKVLDAENPNMILITAHRRENQGDHLRSICQAVIEVANRFPQCEFVFPVHLNPNVQAMAGQILGSAGLKNLHLVKPLGYLPFVYLMSHARLLLTDSGGIQEEAPYLGKPVLVMRDTTERPEAVESGTARVIGTSAAEIVEAVTGLLDDEGTYAGMARQAAPFGDGKSSGRILNACAAFLNGGLETS
jgi:UDP-N-acetylglucosamine 2-epimerase (non-hydrolysing)